MPIPTELIKEYLAGANSLRDAVAGMSHDQVRARPIPGQWSTLEVICHLADFEPVYVDRMKRIIALENPLLMGADQDLFAKKLAYHDRDLEEEVSLIDLTRRSMARILKTLPLEAFARSGIHSERGVRTLQEMLVGAVGHIQHHLPFIAQKRRALG
ncbi:MAG: DinB family protein [Gemmataceae bacterium]